MSIRLLQTTGLILFFVLPLDAIFQYSKIDFTKLIVGTYFQSEKLQILLVLVYQPWVIATVFRKVNRTHSFQVILNSIMPSEERFRSLSEIFDSITYPSRDDDDVI